MATVLASMPVTLSSIQSTMVSTKVISVTIVRQFFSTLPSITRFIVFCLNGNMRFNRIHEIKSSINTNGSMNDIHCPKPIPRLSPSGLLRNLRAMALGGVPIGVAIPPRLAATGIESVRATRPLPSGGSTFISGARNVSIIAAVAVLLTNMEKMPVTMIKPKRTFSLFVPKGRNRVFARNMSRWDFDAAIARINPPRNNIIIGSAKVAIISLDDINVPRLGSAVCLKREMPLFDTVSSISVIMPIEVAQAGTASVSHINVANTKMAITLC